MTLLERSVEWSAFTLTRDDGGDGDGLNLEGYAAVFDTPTRINSWEGTFDEQIAPGAFRKTIRERTPVMQFDHGRHPMVGSIPIGAIQTLREDKQGLFVGARLHDNYLVAPLRDAIASGAVDGMSFRFEVVRDEWRDGKGNVIADPQEVMRRIYNGDPKDVLLRTLRELKVPELGPVVFPAYSDTTVAVRAEDVASVVADPNVQAELGRLLFNTTINTNGIRLSTGTTAPVVTPSVGEGSPDGHDDAPREAATPTQGRSRDNLRRFAQRKRVI